DLHLGRGVFVRSHANSDDAYVCVDSAIETLETRIRKHKGKISTLNRKRDNDIEVGAPALRYIIEDKESGNDAAEDAAPLVIAETKTSIPTLTVAEAVMHLDLSDNTAIM